MDRGTDRGWTDHKNDFIGGCQINVKRPISTVGPSPSFKKIFLWLSLQDELLSTPKIITFLA